MDARHRALPLALPWLSLQGRRAVQEELCLGPWGVWSDGERIQVPLPPVAAGVSDFGVCAGKVECLLLCRARSNSD